MLFARPLRYNGRRETAGTETQLRDLPGAGREHRRMPAAFRGEVAAGGLSREAPAEDSISIAGGSDSPAASFNLKASI